MPNDGFNGDPRCPEGVNYLDWLMNVLDPTEHLAGNIDDIILYHRKARIMNELGIKSPKRGAAKVEGISLLDLGIIAPKPQVKRRKL